MPFQPVQIINGINPGIPGVAKQRGVVVSYNKAVFFLLPAFTGYADAVEDLREAAGAVSVGVY
jgi:hypothetical protein